jgi:hypothetical protein
MSQSNVASQETRPGSKKWTMIRPLVLAALLAALAPTSLSAAGVDLTIQMPQGQTPKSAVALNRDMKLETPGNVQGQDIVFRNLLPDTPYDLAITLDDGTLLQGVDMGWYNEEEVKAGTGPMTDEDHQSVRAIVQDIKDFYNKKDLLIVTGNHGRAVALTRLITDKDFHAKVGDEVIWRIELWYFKNQYGGWEKISQVNKVLRRERFASHAAYEKATGNIKWVPELGGIRMPKDKQQLTLKLPTVPTTQGK